MNALESPFNTLTLKRFPESRDRSLRAWDAADELLLNHLHEHCQSCLGGSARVLICNDAHGSLACALHESLPHSWSDSFLAHSALHTNWQANALADKPRVLTSLQALDGVFDLVVIKIPKTQALLEHQLASLIPHIHADTVVIAASLVRHLYRSAFSLLEKYLGPVSTSLAVKKARLVFAQVQISGLAPKSPYPDSYTDKELGFTLLNHANVFCRDRVDAAARLVTQHADKLGLADSVIDLGCGNGVLGIYLQQLQPQAHLTFVDESYMAVESARMNHTTLCSEHSPQARFEVANGLSPFDDQSTALILCNPPFHAQHAVARDSARDFFKQAARVLKPHGELWVVANKHLAYKRTLTNHFHDCKVIASNSGFVIYSASKPRQSD